MNALTIVRFSTHHILSHEILVAKHDLLPLKNARSRPGAKGLLGIVDRFVHFSLRRLRYEADDFIRRLRTNEHDALRDTRD